MATLSFKENALLALQHKEPEYFPITSDMDTCAPRGVGFIQETSCTTGVETTQPLISHGATTISG